MQAYEHAAEAGGDCPGAQTTAAACDEYPDEWMQEDALVCEFTDWAGTGLGLDRSESHTDVEFDDFLRDFTASDGVEVVAVRSEQHHASFVLANDAMETTAANELFAAQLALNAAPTPFVVGADDHLTLRGEAGGSPATLTRTQMRQARRLERRRARARVEAEQRRSVRRRDGRPPSEKPRRNVRVLSAVFPQAGLPCGRGIGGMNHAALDAATRERVGDIPPPSARECRVLPHEYLHLVLTCPAFGFECTVAQVEACFTYLSAKMGFRVDLERLQGMLGGVNLGEVALPV